MFCILVKFAISLVYNYQNHKTFKRTNQNKIKKKGGWPPNDKLFWNPPPTPYKCLIDYILHIGFVRPRHETISLFISSEYEFTL